MAHVRHVHTDYEALLGEGYDRASARFFVIDRINEVLTTWRATRLLDPDDRRLIASYARTFRSELGQDMLPRGPTTTAPGYRPNPESEYAPDSG